jgi:mono/diheme cytochrome c family protein
VGGGLTDEQITILVNGILAGKKPLDPAAGPLPAYAAPLGNPASGQAVFAVYCASCHGAGGNGGTKAGSVIDPAYLGLVSDQYLRTVTIAGRPEFGMPDWHGYIPGKSMSDQEVSDVVAWLVSNRKNEFGQPIAAEPTPQPPTGQPAQPPSPNTSAVPNLP